MFQMALLVFETWLQKEPEVLSPFPYLLFLHPLVSFPSFHTSLFLHPLVLAHTNMSDVLHVFPAPHIPFVRTASLIFPALRFISCPH